MTPQQHAHAQALNEAHDLFGGRPLRGVDPMRPARERWIAARESQLAQLTTTAETPVRSTT